MPWKETGIVSERMKFVVRALSGKEKLVDLCEEFGIHRDTGHVWIKRYEESGNSLSSLHDRSRRPHQSPNKTVLKIEKEVIRLRKKHGWSGKKLFVLLEENGIDVSIPTINRIIKRNGLVKPKHSHENATKRFERSEPNELWQMDFKGEYKNGLGWCYPFTLIDDHSRFSLGIKALDNQRSSSVQDQLIRVFKRYGKPESILTDHGAQWWSATNGHGLTKLSVFILKQDIRIIYSGIGHPQTQGKIERYHRSLDEYINFHGKVIGLEKWQKTFDRFVKEYNHIRPHESLNMQRPAKCYSKSERAFRSNPRKWEYNSGANVRKLSVHGCLAYKGHYYFVSEALAHEWVKVEEYDENQLCVTYRKFPVRQINIETGETKPVMAPSNKRRTSGMS